MITRLEIDGFKSLLGFAVDLEPFTVFIGPNGAGKSNILEALALLGRLARMPIVDAFKQGRGSPSDQFSRFGSEVGRQMRFAAEFLVFGVYTPVEGCSRSRSSRYRYELVIERLTRSSGTERLIATHESLRTMTRDEDAWVPARPEFVGITHYEDEIVRHFVATPGGVRIFPDLPAEEDEVKPDPGRTALARKEVHEGIDTAIPAHLELCQWLRLDLAHLAGSSDRVDTGYLRPDGSNLPTVLADLPPELLGEIRADLVALVPGLSSFFVVPDDDALRIEFELSGGERLPARLISDGTLRLLAVLTALRLDPRPYIIGIEEPENGIYPARLRALVELLQQQAERRISEPPGWVDAMLANLPPQILLTTHSPVLLGTLRRHPQCIRFVDVVHRDHRRVTRARAVGDPSKRGHHTVVSMREIDQILDNLTGEDAE